VALAENVDAPYTEILGINLGIDFNTPIKKATDDNQVCLRNSYAHASSISLSRSSLNTMNRYPIKG